MPYWPHHTQYNTEYKVFPVIVMKPYELNIIILIL